MKLFSLNSPFYQAINKLVTLIYIGMLWCLFSIPIVTSGAATVALYEVMFRVIKNEEGYIFSSFWQAFRKNLRQGSVMGMGVLLAKTIFLFNLLCYITQNTTDFIVEKIVFMLLTILVFMTGSWLFPTMAKFENTMRGHLWFACIMGMKHIGWTILLVILELAAIFCVVLFMYVPLLFIMGIVGFLQANVCDRVFEIMLEKEKIQVVGREGENV